MILYLLFPVIVGLAAAMCLPAHARDVIYGKSKETLQVNFGSETLFRFPLEVKTITEAAYFEIKPANNEEPDFSVLSVKPRMQEKTADVTFVLADGSVIRTQLISTAQRTVKAGKKDSIYDFKPQDELLSSNPNLPDKREPLVVTELDLMRVMLSGEKLSGFEIQNLDFKVDLAVAESPLSVKLVRRYVGSAVNGFIYELRNESQENPVTIQLEKLSIGQPNLALLAQVDRSVLAGPNELDRQTLLRIVTKPGASSRKIVLPTALSREEKP